MKKLVLVLLIAFINIFTLKVSAHAETKTVGQVMLRGNFEGEIVKGIAHVHVGNFMMATNDYKVLFGYHGIQLHPTGNDALRLLVGEYVDPMGLNGVLSAWYILPVGSSMFFFEADYWFPILGKGGNNMFFVGSYSYSIAESVSVGIATEHVVDLQGKYLGAAVGPTAKVGNMLFWMAYDFAPSLPDKTVLLRLMHFF